uniref:Plexin b2b n=2 Tax=Nothobranchius rachovii TaxID=451742 RepID=A0A1A8RPX9_9TELE
MASWISLLLFLLYQSTSQAKENDNVPFPYFLSETSINNVVQDPQTGRIYLGAINMIFQLRPSLHLEARAETGPKEDARTCTPPASACQDTKPMPNLNKLLLIHPSNSSLIVCGSRYRGICSLLNLSNVEQQLYYSDSKGERTYVTSIEDNVNVVGVMSTYRKDARTFDVFLVGKGYGSLDSTKLISTRILQDYNEWVVFESIIEASTVQTTPFVPKYLHDFQYAFKDSGFVYFLFSRTLDGTDNKNLTYVSRLCEDDQHYYSHTELQLNCGQKNKYNKVRAAFVASPGKELALAMTEAGTYGKVNSWNKVLFMVASSDDDENKSALCMYPLNSINERLVDIISACYSDSGKISGFPAVDIPYSFKTDFCSSKIAKDMLKNYKCGADFLPSPLASKPRYALEATEVWSTSSLLTAVAVAVENDHTIAFLGNNQGDVFKIHLTLTPPPYMYSKAPGGTFGEKVNKNLFFDLGLSHLYITTDKKITKVPVQTCLQKKDCQSCVGLRDPYCGWCVLEGRCTRRSECRRAEEKNGWLWSPGQQCVKIVSFFPPNLSCKKTDKIRINIPSLPAIGPSDRLQCNVDSFQSEGTMLDSSQVFCDLPQPSLIPHTPEDQDFVAASIRIFVNETVELATREFKFYNCAATVRKSENTPCMSCVSSSWGCQWNTLDHTCSDKDDAVVGPNIIGHRKGSECPQFENPDPVLIPVGHKTRISFEGINLNNHKDHVFTIGTELMKNVEEEVRSEDGPFYTFSGFNFSYDKSPETNVLFYVKDKDTGKKMDSTLNVTLYNCSMGREDCSLCKYADSKYRCVWCSKQNSCVYEKLCSALQGGPQNTECPNPTITNIIPRFGPMLGGISITIRGSNLGIHKEDIKNITVVGEPCTHKEEKYSVSTSVVCEIKAIDPKKTPWGQVEVVVNGGKRGTSSMYFTYRDPIPVEVTPTKGPKAGGTLITISGTFLETGSKEDILVNVGGVDCSVEHFGEEIICRTGEYRAEKVPSDLLKVTIQYGKNTVKTISSAFQFMENPIVLGHEPKTSFACGGRNILITGSGFDLIQTALMKVQGDNSSAVEYSHERNDTIIHFRSPTINSSLSQPFRTYIQLDNWIKELKPFDYHPDPSFDELTKTVITETSIIIVTGRGFSRAMTASEAQAFVGDVQCLVNTLQDEKLFLDPPSTTPRARSRRQRRDTRPELLDLVIKFGKGEWMVGSVQYQKKDDLSFYIIIPAVIVPMLLIIIISIYCYRRKSQQAEREYEKVKHQLDNLEESVRERCKKEFTDLMTEMMDMSSDLVGSGIPFLDYRMYAERIFFPGHRESPLRRDLDVQECRRQTVEQGLVQLSNLLNSKLFLTKFIHTLESQRTFSPRDRAYVASLLTVALHGKLEYFTDILKTLLNDLVEQYVAKNPKLMLRRTETVVEKLLTNWMSICLYAFLRDSAGESLYMLFRAIKHQVDKGPVDAVTGKAKYTLNDNRLLREDVEYKTLTLNVLVQSGGVNETQLLPIKVLDCDTITQVKEKLLDQVYKGTSFSHRPHGNSLDLEWRSGVAGHLILSDEDLTSVLQGNWKRLNTLQHYKVPDGATVALVPRHTKNIHYDSHDFLPGEKTPMLEDADEGGVKLWHLVKASEEPELPKHRRGSLRERERAKAIPEIYLTRLLSMKGTLQKFVDDLFTVILSTSRPVPLSVKYFFDLLDDQAGQHCITDSETIHIWKTNSLPLRFWINILKNPQFIFDVQVSDHVDAVLSVITQTFMDSCTTAEHKLGRDSPINKLLYARDIPRYKQMVERYYADIRQTISASDQEMNSALAELSRNYSGELNYLVALHELYKYINKYYDQIITALEEDTTAQKMQLGYRLQQIAAAVENKVTDL